jgi:hypothetical protein
MARRPRPALDELMIVNPGSPGAIRAVRLHRRVIRTDETWAPCRSDGHDRVTTTRPRSRFFLGFDGTLYEVID